MTDFPALTTFLTALRARLSDPTLSQAEREEACRAVLVAVSAEMVWVECRRG